MPCAVPIQVRLDQYTLPQSRAFSHVAAQAAEVSWHTSGATAMMLRACHPRWSLCWSSKLPRSASCSCSLAGSPSTLSRPQPFGRGSAAWIQRSLRNLAPHEPEDCTRYYVVIRVHLSLSAGHDRPARPLQQCAAAIAAFVVTGPSQMLVAGAQPLHCSSHWLVTSPLFVQDGVAKLQSVCVYIFKLITEYSHSLCLSKEICHE